eukprot:6114973-Pleurochrysis_carterae.AAC.2
MAVAIAVLMLVLLVAVVVRGGAARLRTRLDGSVRRHLALVLWREQRVHQLGTLEVLHTLRAKETKEM